MTKTTKVVCSTVGPYAKYGTLLVKSCVNNKTHYCDLAGEAQWIRKIIDLHHEEAKNNEVKNGVFGPDELKQLTNFFASATDNSIVELKSGRYLLTKEFVITKKIVVRAQGNVEFVNGTDKTINGFFIIGEGGSLDISGVTFNANFKDAGDHVILNGAKMWISNSPFADIAVVWAKNEEGKIKGIIVERGMEGFTTPETHNKWSLRASATGELVFDNVKVPKENILPNVEGLKGPLGCLNQARYGIAWGAIGAAMDCYDTALRYSKERIQFDRPIGGFQLQQKKLAEMITEITKAQLMNWRLGVLKSEDRATAAQISMAKRNSVETAMNCARDARQMLGGMGITGEYPIMRHMMNLESVATYEGTHDIHLLITGMDVTGLNAFK